MTSLTTVAPIQGFGSTSRRDNWWASPAATVAGLMLFIVYATYAGMTGTHFEIRQDRAGFSGPELAPYLSPFYSPLIYDAESQHAWIKAKQPDWWPGLIPFSSAALILAGPASFRFTCYYYRKAYYRAFWADPPACVVGEPRKGYWGENHLPLILQNLHRYTMYVAVLFLTILWWDVLKAFWWPTDRAGQPLPGGAHQFGMGLGTLVMLVNVILLTGFTMGCNSVRHLVGGGKDCFSCVHAQGAGFGTNKAYSLWRLSTFFNNNHMAWAWFSLFSVGFADVYIRMCSLGLWSDIRFF